MSIEHEIQKILKAVQERKMTTAAAEQRLKELYYQQGQQEKDRGGDLLKSIRC